MKNFFKIITTLCLLVNVFLAPIHTFAEENDTNAPEVVQENTAEEESNNETLTDSLVQESPNTHSSSKYSFGTVLLAFLIPSILLVICYLIFKVFKF